MKKEIISLRKLMAEEGIDAYFVPSGDFHGSEYVNAFFRTREFLSGFTGSAGELLVTAEGAWLWTDGRYFLQAAAQLAGSGIETIILNTGEWQAELAAGEALRGDIYARLRAGGVTSSGFDYVVSVEGVLVTVNGETYRLDDENALIPMEGD
jgi:hypothetical protein